MFCADLMTPESLWCHNGVAMHVTYKTMHRFSTMLGSPPPMFWLSLQILASWCINKANLRDLIAATGLLILLKLDLNRRFFSPCDLDIWWMTQKNNRAPLQCYFKLLASFRSHWWIQTGVTVRKRLIWVKIDAFFSRVTLKFDGWPSKTIGHLFYASSSFAYHFVAIG